MYIQIIKGWMKEQNDFLFLKFTTNFFKFNKILRIQNKIKRQNISFVVFNVKKDRCSIYVLCSSKTDFSKFVQTTSK